MPIPTRDVHFKILKVHVFFFSLIFCLWIGGSMRASRYEYPYLISALFLSVMVISECILSWANVYFVCWKSVDRR